MRSKKTFYVLALLSLLLPAALVFAAPDQLPAATAAVAASSAPNPAPNRAPESLSAATAATVPATSAASTTAASPLAVAKPDFDFGTVKAGVAVEHDFVVENSGTAAARILSVRSSCGCTVGQASVMELPPGGTSTVHVRFDSSGRSGVQNKTVYIQTDAATNPLLTCRLLGTVDAPAPPPVAAAAPAGTAGTAAATGTAGTGMGMGTLPAQAQVGGAVLVDFGRVWTDERPQQEVTLSNSGTAPLRLLAVNDVCGCFSSTLDRRVVPPGESTILRLQLHPGEARRELQEIVTVTTDEADVAPLRLTVRAKILPRLVATPALLPLFNTPAGRTVERVLQVTANDGEAFRVTRIDCAVKGLQAEVLPGGTGKTASVRCRFTAPAELGPVGGVITIVTDRAAGGAVSLQVMGSVVTSGGSL